MTQEKFLKENEFRFECQGSGNCCTSRGSYGYVYLDLKDQKRMALTLKLDLKTFRKLHCEKSDEYYHLKNPDQDCGFLEKKRCTVYEGRPTQCRTWPFWPENMNPKVWSKEVSSFCPGIGKGRVYKTDEIKKIFAEQE